MTLPRSTSLPSLLVKTAAAIAVSAGALWWAFRDVDLGYVGANLGRTRGAIIASYIGIQLVIHGLRVMRYWLLVSRLGSVSRRAVFSAASVGIPAAVFLPLRLGELVRPLMMTRAGLPLAGALASVVVERVVDGLVNVGLFFGLLSFMPPTARVLPEVKRLALLPLLVFGGALVFLGIAYAARERALGLVERWVSRISAPVARRVVGLISTFLDGLVALGTLPRVVSFLALTASYWALNGYATYLLGSGYGLEIPPIAGPFAIACIVFAVTVPAGPAFAGTLEAGFRIGLAPFGVPASDVALVAVVSHVLQLALLALFGFVGLQAALPSQRKGASDSSGARGGRAR